MRKLAAALLLATTLLATGCGDLLSLHALFTPGDQVFDRSLEGTWEDKDTVVVITRDDASYLVTMQPKSKTSDPTEYEVHFVDIHGIRFADVLLKDSIGHLILRVRATERELHLAFLDSEWLRKRVPHEEADVDRGGKQAILTMSTPQLRRMVARFGGRAEAYDPEEMVLTRVNQ